MNVSCGSCPAKYAIPDEKVRGRKVRITCKRCGAPIVVDGTSAGQGAEPAAAPSQPSADTSVAAAAASRRRGMKQTMIGIAPISPGAAPAPAPLPLLSDAARADANRAMARANADPPTPIADHVHATKRTIVGGIEAPRIGIPTPPVMNAVQAPIASSPQNSAPEWTVAITDDQHEEMSTGEVVELFAAGTINEETFIWKEGMEDWKTPLEIPAIAERIDARGLRVRSAPRAAGSQPGLRKFGFEGLAGRGPIEKQGPGTPMGVWREPGSAGWGEIPGWSEPEAAGGDVSFDDVTVAMAAPQAEELLRAAGANALNPSPHGTAEERGPFSAESGLLSDPNAETKAYYVGVATPGTGTAATAGFETPLAQRAAQPSESTIIVDPSEQSERAARRHAASDRDQDLFADLERAGAEPEAQAESRSESPSQPRLTGARNESSVLFSLDAMITKEGSEPDQPERAESEEDLLGLSTSDVAEPPADVLAEAPAESTSGLLESAAPSAEPTTSLSTRPPAGAPAIARALQSQPPDPEPKGNALMWIAVLLTLALLGAGGALLLTRPKSLFGGSEPEPPASAAAPANEEVAAPAPPPPAPEPAPAATDQTAPSVAPAEPEAGAASAAALDAATGKASPSTTPDAAPRARQQSAPRTFVVPRTKRPALGGSEGEATPSPNAAPPAEHPKPSTPDTPSP
ncbi:MAG TPA: zinc-ribbon domain-containing protein [Polyangiaceae bacterium]|nr:zinc-ribbon domain-containing protein [Polyangiaceae bacterium]